uniref:Uncharacterized protein n=1 Tax=Sphaerodactylus townsendi TaxID=933632 RepID=A0ACB8EQR7_9SAUR
MEGNSPPSAKQPKIVDFFQVPIANRFNALADKETETGADYLARNITEIEEAKAPSNTADKSEKLIDNSVESTNVHNVQKEQRPCSPLEEMEFQTLEDNLEDSCVVLSEQEQIDITHRLDLLTQELTMSRRSPSTITKCHHQMAPAKEPGAHTISDLLIPVKLNNKPPVPKQAGQDLSLEPPHEVEIDRWSNKMLINNQLDANKGKSWAQELAEISQASSLSALKTPHCNNSPPDSQPWVRELTETEEPLEVNPDAAGTLSPSQLPGPTTSTKRQTQQVSSTDFNCCVFHDVTHSLELVTKLD